MLDPLGDWLRAHPFAHLALMGGGSPTVRVPREIDGARLAWLDASTNGTLVAQYLRLNRQFFPALPLPAWVLSDVYLLPGFIAMVLGGPSPHPEDRGAPEILAAWVGLPSIGADAVGVSLFSRQPGAGALIKWVGARALGVNRVRGVVQASSRAIRTHARLGPLQVLGPAPVHECGDSFVYACDLSDEAAVRARLARAAPDPSAHRVDSRDPGAISALLARARSVGDVWIVPPGLDDGHLCVCYAPAPEPGCPPSPPPSKS